MPGLIRTDIFIGRTIHCAALVPDGRCRYARRGGKCCFHTPETSCSKGRLFHAHASFDARHSTEVTVSLSQHSAIDPGILLRCSTTADAALLPVSYTHLT